MTGHIWACPPSEGDDYIFHCHPPDQKIPKPKRLQEWYKKMLDKAFAERIINDYKVPLLWESQLIGILFPLGTHTLYNSRHLQESRNLEASGEAAESTVQLVKAVGLSVSVPQNLPTFVLLLPRTSSNKRTKTGSRVPRSCPISKEISGLMCWKKALRS